METFQYLQPLGISFLLGLLVGLQRERANEPLAGLRTFPMIAVLGTLTALLDQKFQAGGWIVAGGLIGVTALVVFGNRQRSAKAAEVGITTEVAILLVYAIGGYLTIGDPLVAVAIGVGCALLLEFKPELHGFVARLENKDVRAVMQFALITFVVLPVLPNTNYGPPGLEVINPYKAWLMVVLIVSISFGSYVLYKLFGQTMGPVLGGVLGGAISSTATTVSYARRASESEKSTPVAVMVVMVASVVVFVRVLIMIAIVAPTFLPAAAPPLGCMLAAALVTALVSLIGVRDGKNALPEMENPTELKSALVFGALFVLILLGLAAAKQYLGDRAMYVVAWLSGLVDMDAITLSTARLVSSDGGGGLSVDTGWRLIAVALIGSLVFKTGIVALLGNRPMLAKVGVLFGVQLLVTIAVMALWPPRE